MPKKEDFIAIFKAEAIEHVASLEKELVALEKDTNNGKLIKSLSMTAHTLKGSARVFGFDQIQAIAHKIEDILGKVSQKSLEFNSSIANSIFKGLDNIKAILDRISKEEHIKIDISNTLSSLEECLSNYNKEKYSSSSPAQPENIEHKAEAQPTVTGEEYIRVPISRVNELLNLSGEMIINKMKTNAKTYQVKRLVKLAKETQHIISSLKDMLKGGAQYNNDIEKLFLQCSAEIESLKEEAINLGSSISKESLHLDPIIDKLQANMKEMRMLPLSTILEGFPRMVRDIASEKAKSVNLDISGEQTELDKKVLEGIKDPLIHILRNCVDHGIEDSDTRNSLGKPKFGTIKLSASHEEGNVVIRVEDDGKGIDIEEIKKVALKKNFVSREELDAMDEKEIVNIVFMNGYSTSSIITDVSGRGIGLDIVRHSIENLKGKVVLDTEKNKGTKITIILPLTIAVIHILLLKIEGLLFGIPVASITETIRFSTKYISTIEGKMAIQLRGHTLPLVRLRDIFRLDTAFNDNNSDNQPIKEKEHAIVVSSLDRQIGFIVDEIIGEEEVFIKSLGAHLGKINNVSGATILWSGEIVAILDVEDLIANSRLSHPAIAARKASSEEKKKAIKILVVEDAVSTRELEKNILETEGYIVDTAVDGIDALEKIIKVKYDLIITDIQMPRMEGFEFCENLKKNDAYKDTPVIIVTALAKEEDKRRGIEVGASAYVIKTAFDQSSLLDTIERLIG